MNYLILAFCTLLLQLSDPVSACAQATFSLEVVRSSLNQQTNLVTGALFVNGKFLGTSYERFDKRIGAGTYPGFIRYFSQAGHAQGPFGEMSQKGDFLLEIGNVRWTDGVKRTDLLFHGGNKPEHSKGCIMLGAVTKDSNGNRVLSNDHPLRKLRLEFYGSDNPDSTPNKSITIVITEPD